MRRRWGCDGPADGGRKVFSTSCPRCIGTGDGCELCGGKGAIEHDRCPAFVAQGTAELMRAVSDVEGELGLPAPGVWCEQAAFFTEALVVVRAERNRIHTEQQAAGAEARALLMEH